MQLKHSQQSLAHSKYSLDIRSQESQIVTLSEVLFIKWSEFVEQKFPVIQRTETSPCRNVSQLPGSQKFVRARRSKPLARASSCLFFQGILELMTIPTLQVSHCLVTWPRAPSQKDDGSGLESRFSDPKSTFLIPTLQFCEGPGFS